MSVAWHGDLPGCEFCQVNAVSVVVLFFVDRALFADDDAAGVLAEELAVVGDHQEGGLLLFVQIHQQLHDVVGGVVVQVTGRLVCQDELGMVEECAGDGNPLLLAS